MATILDVSRRAGVAKSTVSRVLSGRGYTSEKTREVVLKAAQELNYRPNVLARNLALQTSNTIGLILPSGALVSRYLASLVDEIFKKAQAAGKDVIMKHVDDRPGLAMESIYNLIDHRCEAVMYYNSSSFVNFDDTVAEIDAAIDSFSVPVVLLNGYLPKHPKHCVWYEHARFAAKPVEYLLEHGHRNIAYITGPLNQRTVQERVKGYRQALEHHGIEYNEQLFVEGSYKVLEDDTLSQDVSLMGYEACIELLERGVNFSAICFANDYLAIGAQKALQERGIDVPSEVSLIGFADTPVLNYFSPSISSVVLPSTQLINYAVELCFAHLSHSELPDYDSLYFDSELVLRGSVKAL